MKKNRTEPNIENIDTNSEQLEEKNKEQIETDIKNNLKLIRITVSQEIKSSFFGKKNVFSCLLELIFVNYLPYIIHFFFKIRKLIQLMLYINLINFVV